MVFHDLSVGKKNSVQPSENQKFFLEGWNIGSLNDRVLASFFDFLLFSPVINLFVAGISRQIKLSTLLDADDSLVGLFWIIYFFFVIVGISLLMALFLFYWGATPGQRYMQLRVVVFPKAFTTDKVTLDKCLLRSMAWCLSWFSFGLPFLEVISHPLRRAFHERASDTLVISLKKIVDGGPVEIETQFVRLLLRFCYGCVFVGSILFLAHVYEELLDDVSNVSSKTVVNGDCKKILGERPSGVLSLDYLLSLKLAQVGPKDCLNTEVSRIFRVQDEKQTALAYYAKGMLTEDESERNVYFSKVCEKSKVSEECEIANFFKNEKQNKVTTIHMDLKEPMLFTRLLLLKQYMLQRDYFAAVALIKNLNEFKEIAHFLDKKYVTSVWEIRKRAESKDSRLPASVNVKEIYSEFEKKFGDQ